MKCLLGLLVGFEILDGVLTFFLLGNETLVEGNPFLQPLVGEANFLLIKVLGGFLCALLLWDIYQRYPWLAMITTSCFAMLYAGIVGWNLGLFLMV